ncbi:MAG: LPS export ABC transporter periplasmic protein LptC [Elusimicrobiota bacterium]
MEKKADMRNVFPILFFLLCCACSPEGPPASSGEDSPEPGKYISNFTLTERIGEKKEWKLEAASAKFSEGKKAQTVSVDNYKIVFFEDDLSVSELKGTRGKYNRKTGVFRDPGNVVIISKKRKIATSDLTWDPKEDAFATDSEVEIHTEGGVVRGKGMVASRGLDEINIKERISGELK